MIITDDMWGEYISVMVVDPLPSHNDYFPLTPINFGQEIPLRRAVFIPVVFGLRDTKVYEVEGVLSKVVPTPTPPLSIDLSVTYVQAYQCTQCQKVFFTNDTAKFRHDPCVPGEIR